jgi:hypothetical protein
MRPSQALMALAYRVVHFGKSVNDAQKGRWELFNPAEADFSFQFAWIGSAGQH